jgi:hypothetical protein
MKKAISIFAVALYLVACSKDNTEEEPKMGVINATIEENFTDIYKQRENIQVDDYVPYKISIEDNATEGNKAEYRLTPIREGEDYHQMIWKDFGLYLSRNESSADKSKTYITFHKKGVYSFYVRPLVPGTFKHIYELQKFINGKPVGNIVKLQLTFNAVSIKVYYKTKEIWKKIFWPMMEPREEIEKVIINLSLMIDDGDNATDTYLSAPKTTQRYSISYVYLINDAETRKEGLFFKKQKMDLEQKEEDGKLYVKTYPTINSLKILQKLSNLPEYIIEYRDIKVYDDGVTKEVKY